MTIQEYNAKFVLTMALVANSMRYAIDSVKLAVDYLQELIDTDLNDDMDDIARTEMKALLQGMLKLENERLAAASSTDTIFKRILHIIQSTNDTFYKDCYDLLMDQSIDNKKLPVHAKDAILFSLVELQRLIDDQSISSGLSN